MAQQPSILKYPTESRLYYVDFSPVLATGEVVSGASVSVTQMQVYTPNGFALLPFDNSLTLAAPIVSTDGLGVQIGLNLGTAGNGYTLTVNATGTIGNHYTQDITVGVETASWMVEMLATLRILINDFTVPPIYSDARLLQVLLVGAKYVTQELAFLQNYYVSVNDLMLDPDPTAPTTFDQAFANFVVLRAACFIDQSTLRTKAALAGIKAVMGPASLDTTGLLGGYVKVLENGPCASYEELKLQFSFGNPLICQAILSPFVNNKFDPQILAGYYTLRSNSMWSQLAY